MRVRFTEEEEIVIRSITDIYDRSRFWRLSFKQQLVVEHFAERFINGHMNFNNLTKEASIPNNTYYRKKVVDYITSNYEAIVRDQKSLNEFLDRDNIDYTPDASFTVGDWNNLTKEEKEDYKTEFITKNTDV